MNRRFHGWSGGTDADLPFLISMSNPVQYGSDSGMQQQPPPLTDLTPPPSVSKLSRSSMVSGLERYGTRRLLLLVRIIWLRTRTQSCTCTAGCRLQALPYMAAEQSYTFTSCLYVKQLCCCLKHDDGCS